MPALLRRLSELGIGFKDLNTRKSSLEDIFVSLVSDRAMSRRDRGWRSIATASGPSTTSRWRARCAPWSRAWSRP